MVHVVAYLNPPIVGSVMKPVVDVIAKPWASLFLGGEWLKMNRWSAQTNQVWVSKTTNKPTNK